MAYLDGFESDFFVSYAHQDDEPSPDAHPPRGWVSQFHNRLLFELKRAVGENVAIWRDQTSLRRSEGFDDRIQDALDQSAFLLVLTSRSSLQSKYCTKEVARFTEKVAPGDALPPRLGAGRAGRRIVHILLDKIDHSEWPPEVQGTNPFNFYETNDSGEAVGPLAPGSDAFREEMNNLKVELRALLTEARRVKPPERRPALPQAVFLADVDPLEHGPLRAKIKDELLRRKKSVLEPGALGAGAGSGSADAATAATVSVHLFGPRPYAPAVQQFEACRRAGSAQIIWLYKDVALPDATSDPYLTWLRELEHSEREPGRSTVIRSTYSKAAPQILEAVEAFSPPAPVESPAILIHAHERDKDAAYAAWEYLKDNNVRARLDHYAEGPTRGRFEELLREASALVVFFGEVNWDWVKNRIREARQVAPDTLKTMSVCLAPPADSNKRPSEVDQPNWLHLMFVDNSRGFDPKAWDETLAAVAQ